MASALTNQPEAYSDDAAEATVMRAGREHAKYETIAKPDKSVRIYMGILYFSASSPLEF